MYFYLCVPYVYFVLSVMGCKGDLLGYNMMKMCVKNRLKGGKN